MMYTIKVDGEYRQVDAKGYLYHGAYVDDNDIIRWESNDNVPPDDCLKDAGVPFKERYLCSQVRDAEQAAFIADYIKAQEELEADTSPEAMDIKRERDFERRAAFGEGVEVVDVFTGQVSIT